jgi:hypothetical protein
MGALGLAFVVLMGANAAAADDWFVLGEKTLTPADTNAEVKAEAGKFLKEDIKKTKISVEGADVEVSKVVLRWNNHPDDTISNLGILKAGGQTAPKDAPGREATLMSVAVQYKILNNAPSATLKVWGYD